MASLTLPNPEDHKLSGLQRGAAEAAKEMLVVEVGQEALD